MDTVVTRQEPEAAFRAARAVFATNRAEAATQLRHASRFIKNEASLASGRAHDDLQASARAVDRMIEDLEGARALTVDVLDAAAAHAHAALASAHLARARRDRAGQQNHAAGEQVIAAASHLALASGYSGRRESAVDSAAAVARELGAKLVRGAGWTEQEVSTALEGLEAHIEQVARRAPGGAL